jgi:asparagine synthase (glutamine-hydrolysing)
MCGIAGIMDSVGRRPIDRSLAQRMTDSIAHRGPDGSGFHIAPGVALGHRRLAIIDVAGGHQPLYNEDGTVAITYNGEIYNYRELADELAAKGHRFRTRSDTEVVVHAWEEWGADCVKRFRGMFAFAIWDETRETLFLARDRFGKKPLYYARLDDGLVLFASEMKALLTCPELRRSLDPTAIEDYFAYGYVPESKSIYRDVHKVPPGHVLVVRRGQQMPPPRMYWDLAFDDGSRITEGEAQEELIARLREAVKIRLISEVPLGAFLSGGVDSSAVVAMMAETSDRVDSFSIGFTQAAFDESEYAERVADQFKTRHHSRIVDANDFDLVGRLARIYDEPFADASAIPTFRVSALAREKVTVALSGDGGDELFAGYRRYRWHHSEEKVRRLVPDAIRRPLLRGLGRIYPKFDWAPKPFRAKATLLELAENTVDGYFNNVSMLDDGIRRQLFTPQFRNALQGYHAKEELSRYFSAAPTEDPLSAVQYVDVKTYLAGDILTKVDRASMANSLETRAPLLDHVFAEWTGRVPSGLKLNRGEGKYIFKRALESRLPRDVLYRRKMGFAVPLAAWFRGPLRERVQSSLGGARLRETGWFDGRFVAKAFSQHAAGLRDYSTLIWSLLMFDAFLSDVHEGTAPEPSAMPEPQKSVA